MSQLPEAAQQALEALEWFNKYGSEEHGPSLRGAEHVLRAALDWHAEVIRNTNAQILEAARMFAKQRPDYSLEGLMADFACSVHLPIDKALTDAEIADLWHQSAGFHHHFARAVERFHGIGREA